MESGVAYQHHSGVENKQNSEHQTLLSLTLDKSEVARYDQNY